MPTLSEIDKLTKVYADQRALVAERVERLNAEIETLKRRLLPGIRTAVADAKNRQAELAAALQDSPELFVRPRSIILHGTKVGFSKSKGKLSWADDASVAKLIKRNHADLAEVLIKTTEKPVKKALEKLSTTELKKLGITVSGAGDYVLIKPADSDVDKIVTALLGEPEQETDDGN